MRCSTCNAEKSKLTQVYMKNWPDLDVDVSARPHSVCGDCLVGWAVPVFRKELKEWELGLVEQFNSETQEHCIQFDDDEQQEWAIVEASPFTAYVSHYKEEWAEKKTQHHISKYSTDFHADSRSNSYKFEDYFKVHQCFNSPQRPKSSSKNPKMKRHTSKHAADSDRLHRPSASNALFEAAEEDKKKAAIKEGIGGTYYDIGGTYKSPQKAIPSLGSLASPSSTDTDRTNQTRLWTVEEDRMLLRTIEANDFQCKWPAIAKSIPGRSGKQCRERYLNHLRPSLKLAKWSPQEDAVLFRLFYLEGTKWALISKLLPGRTDNSVKNRFHHLKRRFDRQCSIISNTIDVEELVRKLGHCQLVYRLRLGKQMLKYIAHRALYKNTSTLATTTSGTDSDYSFGPFRVVEGSFEICARCSFGMPSVQTGRLACERTGWCETCTRISPCLSDDTLRSIHDVGKLAIRSKNVGTLTTPQHPGA